MISSLRCAQEALCFRPLSVYRNANIEKVSRMLDKSYLLTDRQMRFFVGNGYVILKTALPASFHRSILQQTETAFEKEGNPGDNLLPRIPEIGEVFDSRIVHGALTSILGEDYYLQPHRHAHHNPPGSNGQKLHQDSGEKDRSHLTRRLLAFYYPQDTTAEMGPSGIVPGSHYYNTPEGANISAEMPLCGEAGTVTLVNKLLWHRALPNRSAKKRYMMKFLFARMSEPRSPSWNSDEDEWCNEYDGEGRIHHQRVFKHLWDWHYGVGNGKRSKPTPSVRRPISELVQALGNASEREGINAAYALGTLGTAAVVPLLKILGDGSEVISRNARYALSASGGAAVEGLMGALGDPAPEVRAGAAETLGDIGLQARSALPALINATEDDSEPVRNYAAEALGITGQNEPTAVPALVASLKDESFRVRQRSVFALARIGRYASGAIEALNSVLSDGDRYVRGDAVHALRRIATQQSQDVLLDHLTKSRWCPLSTPDSTHGDY